MIDETTKTTSCSDINNSLNSGFTLHRAQLMVGEHLNKMCQIQREYDSANFSVFFKNEWNTHIHTM